MRVIPNFTELCQHCLESVSMIRVQIMMQLDHDCLSSFTWKETEANNDIQYEQRAILTYVVLQYNDNGAVNK